MAHVLPEAFAYLPAINFDLLPPTWHHKQHEMLTQS